MIVFKSFLCSLLWLVFGVIFGLASILLIFASSAIFDNPLSLGNIIDANIVVFLCIALMSGAGTDFLISANYNIWNRLFMFAIVVVFLALAYFLLSPNNRKAPSEKILHLFEIGYSIVAFGYCVTLKSLLIYRERLNHNKAQHL
jgi:hypothetical protein